MASHIRSGLILLFVGYVLLRFTQPYFQSYQFQRLLDQELATERISPDSAGVYARVLEQGRRMGMTVRPDDVQVERLVRGYRIRVQYEAPLDLKVYKTTLTFVYDERTPGEY